MKYDLLKEFVDETGTVSNQKYKKVVVDENGDEKTVLSSEKTTLGRVIKDCVLYQVDDKEDMTEEEVLLRGDLFDRCSGSEIDLTRKENEFIKKLVLKRYMPCHKWQIIRELNNGK
jgi:hypothetical protein